jgi:hypothetical protein
MEKGKPVEITKKSLSKIGPHNFLASESPFTQSFFILASSLVVSGFWIRFFMVNVRDEE